MCSGLSWTACKQIKLTYVLVRPTGVRLWDTYFDNKARNNSGNNWLTSVADWLTRTGCVLANTDYVH